MTEKELLDNIECKRYAMIQSDRLLPKYISMNEKTKFKIKKNIRKLWNIEILIDDKLADDEFRLLRK